jgi:hypothetical protein
LDLAADDLSLLVEYFSACDIWVLAAPFTATSLNAQRYFDKSNGELGKAAVQIVHFCGRAPLVCLAVQRQVDHNLDECVGQATI